LDQNNEECIDKLNRSSNLQDFFDVRPIDYIVDVEYREMYVATTHANSESVWVYVVDMDTARDVVRSVQLQLTINNDLSNLVL
jgi:hypothetical protein